MNKPQNNRYQETEQKIQKAFLSLLESRHIDQISIQQLCQCAQISRPTFYAHYEDINDLILKIEYEKSLYISSILTSGKDLSLNDFEDYLNYIQENRHFYIAYFQCQPSNISHSMMQQYLSANREKETPSLKYQMLFFMAGLKAVVLQWLWQNCPESTEQLAKVLMQQYLLFT